MDGLVYDNAGVLRTVNVNWNDDGWNLNANPIENPNRWNDGNQVFSRNSTSFSLSLRPGSFRYTAFLPTTELTPDLFQPSCKISILFIRDELIFPDELYEKFDYIKTSDCFVEHRDFMLRRKIRKAKCEFDAFEKCLLNFVSDSVPLDFRKTTIESEPETIGFLQLENYLW